MLAASDAFISSINICILDDGELIHSHLRVAAMDAGMRLLERSPGYATPQINYLPFYWVNFIIDNPGDHDWIRMEARKYIDAGMPFVGWAIDADNRRISGPAQPGEGEFIKYLGRNA